MSQINNPKKAFNFGIYAPGLNPYTVQTANIPDFEVETVEHGDTNYRVKTAGMMVFGNITLEKLRPLNLGDNWVWNWIRDVQNVETGGGQIAEIYKRNIDIVQYSYDNVTVTDRWNCWGVFPVRINNMSLSRTQSENSMETIELSVDRVVKTT